MWLELNAIANRAHLGADHEEPVLFNMGLVVMVTDEAKGRTKLVLMTGSSILVKESKTKIKAMLEKKIEKAFSAE